LRLRLDKDLAWVIIFASFLVFLLASIGCSILENQPKAYPEAVVIANASLGRHFALSLFGFMRCASLAAIGLGIFGIIVWPPGQGTS